MALPGTDNSKFPSASVVVLLVVFFIPTVAPINGSPVAETIFPDIFLSAVAVDVCFSCAFTCPCAIAIIMQQSVIFKPGEKYFGKIPLIFIKFFSYLQYFN